MKTTNPIDIKVALEKAGYSQSKIADTLGVKPASVHGVIFKGVVSARIRAAIEEAIGRPVNWPKRKAA